MVTNPVTIALNEIVVGISAQDILYELRREECVSGIESSNMLARLSRDLIEQRHFFPLYPPTARENLPKPTSETALLENEEEAHQPKPLATGAMLDTSYLALADFQHVRPDILITPSALPPFAKVVESVVVINPGTISKKRGAGTFAQLVAGVREVGADERRITGGVKEGGGGGDDEAKEEEEEEEETVVVGAKKLVSHLVFERARVDVVRI